MPRRAPRLFAALLVLPAAGCVRRVMTVESSPPGALVYLNGQEVGRTPLTRDFLWYGTYDVALRKEGYETRKARTRVIAPWWQIPPIDLLAELNPLRPTDRRRLTYTLTPSDQKADPAGLLGRAEQLRKRM